MMSPKRAPASAAGPATVVSTMNTPLALTSPSDSASGSSTGSILMPSQPFWPSLERLPTLTGSLTRRPTWAGRIGADGAGAGDAGWGLAGTGAGCGDAGVTGTGTTAGAGPVGMRTMSMPAPASLASVEAARSDGGAGAKARVAQAPSQRAASIAAAHAMAPTGAVQRPRNRREDGDHRASVIAETPGQDLLGRLLGQGFLWDVLGRVLGGLPRLPGLARRRPLALSGGPLRPLGLRGPFRALSRPGAGRGGRRGRGGGGLGVRGSRGGRWQRSGLLHGRRGLGRRHGATLLRSPWRGRGRRRLGGVGDGGCRWVGRHRRGTGGEALPRTVLPAGIGGIRGRRLRHCGSCRRGGRSGRLRRLGGGDGRRLHGA